MEVRIYPVQNSTIKANVTVTIEGICIKDFKIIEGKNGLFVSNPNRKNEKGEYKDTVYPVTKEAREKLHNTIIEKYYSYLGTGEVKGTYITVDDDKLPF